MTEREFNGYYEKCRRMIYLYSLKKSREKYIAEEVTAQVFIELWKNRETIKDPHHAREYLFNSTRHRMINFYVKNSRKRKAYANIHIEEAVYDTPLAEIDRLEQQVLTKVFEIIEELPERNKEIFMLTCIKQMYLREAAKVVGVSVPTACRARKEAFGFIKQAVKLSY
jgi:RNA polymerase sigma factor (sigma-70 family)